MNLIPTHALHFIGNGYVAMGGEGADILQLFAPCYSMPGVMTLKLADPDVNAKNFRIRGSAGYLTTLTDEAADAPIGELLDYTHATAPVFIRKLTLTRPLTFAFETPFRVTDTSAVFDGEMITRLFEIPDGTPIFSKSKTDKEIYCQLLLSPTCRVEEGNITFPKGESYLMFVGGVPDRLGKDSFSSCMKLSEIMISADQKRVLKSFYDLWKAILDCVKVDPRVLAILPDGEELVESVATALITQTSAEGGVIAGAFYHLAYGRDMYGVFRAYMALGLHDYARRMIDYMEDTYRKKGYMPNASGMGMSCSHRHENDNVEQTGYYLLELLDYVDAMGDPQFLRDRLNYADYLLDAQEKELADSMLPFNGDETYIAGGIFPRGGIDHGSMEATALYISSALRFLDMVEKYELMDDTYVAIHRQLALKAKEAFLDHFTEGDTVYVNQPSRLTYADLPTYRHGVCHNCLWMTNLLRTPEGGYLCPTCYGKATASADSTRYSLDCALWMSVFAGCDLLPERMIRTALDRTVTRLRDSGFGETDPHNTVGYELGVILYALAEYLPDEAASYRDLLNALLDDRVQGSVWTEYYRNGKPSLASCPYRPWESGINLVGILKYCGTLPPNHYI